jgi:hypothetical protein
VFEAPMDMAADSDFARASKFSSSILAVAIILYFTHRGREKPNRESEQNNTRDKDLLLKTPEDNVQKIVNCTEQKYHKRDADDDAFGVKGKASHC